MIWMITFIVMAFGQSTWAKNEKVFARLNSQLLGGSFRSELAKPRVEKHEDVNFKDCLDVCSGKEHCTYFSWRFKDRHCHTILNGTSMVTDADPIATIPQGEFLYMNAGKTRFLKNHSSSLILLLWKALILRNTSNILRLFLTARQQDGRSRCSCDSI